MAIRFSCSYCGHKMEADEFVAGKSITCDSCNKLTMIPPLEREVEPPRLKTPKLPQVYETISEEWKHCPDCRSPVDPKANVCAVCGFSFTTGKSGRHKEAPPTALGNLVRGASRLAVRMLGLALLIVVGYSGILLIQKTRYLGEIHKAMGDGNLSLAADDYRQLASWYWWLQYFHHENPYEMRTRQFQAHEGKTYEKTRPIFFPLIVDRSVWGNRSQFIMKTAWIRFRFANLSKQQLTVSREMFLLIGLDNNLAFADQLQKADPDPVTLQNGEAIQGALYFGGMFKPPAFLEFNNGGLVVRAPVYVNYAMDNYQRDNRDWPSDRGAEEFPLLKKWDESKLDAKAVHVLWADFSKQQPPPAEPYSTVLKEPNPR